MAIISPVKAPRKPELRIQLRKLTSPSPLRLVNKCRPSIALLRWVSPDTNQKVERAVKEENGSWSCTECGHHGSRRRIRIHVRQPFSMMLCPCQFQHSSRDSVYDHQVTNGRTIKHGGADGPVYVVDEAEYDRLIARMGWTNPPPFGPCLPGTDKVRKPT